MRDEALKVHGINIVLVYLIAIGAGNRYLLLNFRILHFRFLELQQLLKHSFSLLGLFWSTGLLFFADSLQQFFLPVIAQVSQLPAHLLEILELVKAIEVNLSDHIC